jgi:gustatory receptor
LKIFSGFQVGVDTFFFSCCLNISTQFDILRESFDGDKKKFVEKHLELLNLVKDLNEVINEVVFAQFLLSSLQLCVLGFQVVIVQSIAGLIVPAVYGLTIIIQLFVYSFGGQLIVNSSDAVSQNLYKIDRDLVLMIARPHKSTMINSVFFTADLPSFLSIMRFTGSLITMLKSFVK